MCKQNSQSLEEYFLHVLHSETTPQTMCRIIGMCNSMKLNEIMDQYVSSLFFIYLIVAAQKKEVHMADLMPFGIRNQSTGELGSK